MTRFERRAPLLAALATAAGLSLVGAGCSQDTAPLPPAGRTAAPAAAEALTLPADPRAAVAALRTASAERPVVVFKHSPICPISAAAQDRFHGWLGGSDPDSRIAHVQIDVLAEKPLARGIVAELGIRHESPQVLLFREGELAWHASHGAITGEALREQLEGL